MEQSQHTEAFSKRPSIGAVLLALFCIFIPLLAFLMWTQRQLPPPASLHGEGIDLMINYLLVSVGLMLLAGHAALAWFILRFSARSEVSFRQASGRTEWKLALFPIVIMALVAEGGVLAIGVPVWNKFYARKAPQDAVKIEVTAEQFAWNFRYPGPDNAFGKTSAKLIEFDNPIGLDPEDPAGKDDIVVQGECSVPVGRPVQLFLRSKDVIHSFYLPYHRIKQDTMPGMVIDIWFVPTLKGEYEILCAELCGLGHYKMRAKFNVNSDEEHARWLAAQTTQ